MKKNKSFPGTKKRHRTPRIRKKLPPGTAPGDVGLIEDQPSKITLFTYKHDQFKETSIKDVSQLAKNLDKQRINWVDISGLGGKKILSQIAGIFKLHALTIEDVVNASQRSKMEQYGDSCFIVARMIPSADKTVTRQLSIFLIENTVITIHVGKKDCLDPIRDRIRNGSGVIRKMGADFLVYALIDAVIDTYFPVLERFADHLDFLEEQILTDDAIEPVTINRIHDVKSELLILKRIIWGHRDLLNILQREAPKHMSSELSFYWRDCLDHVMQQMDLVETYRDVCSNLMDLLFSLTNQKSNEVMKVLTVVASIFIPLTFIAGVYGMNFAHSPYNMPELSARYGYPVIILLMVVVASGMVMYFRKKNWI